MIYNFTIEDRNGVQTHIEDPMGWDNTVFTLERDKDKHGILFSYQLNPYTYTGEAYRLLQAEYEQYGVEGEMYLIIEYFCDDGWKTIGKFKYDFTDYVDRRGEDCEATISVEQDDEAMIFRNRIDQKADVLTLLTYDGLTTLPVYQKLPFIMPLPPKNILVMDYSINEGNLVSDWIGEYTEDGNHDGGQLQSAFFVPAFTKKVAEEFGGYVHPSTSDSPEHDENIQTSNDWPGSPPETWVELPYGPSIQTSYFPYDSITPIVNYDSELGPVYGVVRVNIEGRYHKRLGAYNDPTYGLATNGFLRWGVFLGVLKGGKDPELGSSWRWLSIPALEPFWDVYEDCCVPLAGLEVNFAFNHQFYLEPGDRIYYFDNIIYNMKDWSGNMLPSPTPTFVITDYADAYFKVSGMSTVVETTTKACMVNECWSRVAEIITNDKVRVFSNFFGRVDAQPFNNMTTTAADGCGSHLALMNGLMIRNMHLATDRDVPSRLPLSIKDLWDGLNPIYNIGMGFEPDPTRGGGFNWLRVEHWTWFYENDASISCVGVDNVTRTAVSADHVSIFKFGYSKWEAEELNGIDEFMTEREYRTELSQVNRTLDQTSTFIASGYTIELTRRKGYATSEDWRYDNDTFVICVERLGPDFVVELNNIGSPDNIIDPPTVYNFNIRPSTMALRWLATVFESYRDASFFSKILFTDGTGNLKAAGISTRGECIVESQVLREDQTLSVNVMVNPNEGLPILFNETIGFTFPITMAQFDRMRTMPKRQIFYTNDQVSGFGWIRKVDYNVEDGMATFTLIPAR